MGVSAVTDVPQARGYSVSWTDSGNNFWLFGGVSDNSVNLNDLWRYQP
jgi:hypothetical protein